MKPNFKRFSMCNCITVRMEKAAKRQKIALPIRTYTAHVMTTNLFLRKVTPNAVIQIPYASLWPKGFITTYKVPANIQTFLFSPFNVIHHPTYTFDIDVDKIHYVIPMSPAGVTSAKYKRLYAHTKPVKQTTPMEFAEDLKNIDKKVNSIWGNVFKILIFYDYSLAPVFVKKRAALFQKITKETIDWPIIQIKETRPRNQKNPNIWPHYSNKTYIDLLRTIERLERSNATK